MHMDWHGWGMGGGWLPMILFWILIIAAIAALVVFLLRRSGGAGPTGESALDILKKRYAKGEITKEEYESMKRDISSP